MVAKDTARGGPVPRVAAGRAAERNRAAPHSADPEGSRPEGSRPEGTGGGGSGPSGSAAVTDAVTADTVGTEGPAPDAAAVDAPGRATGRRRLVLCAVLAVVAVLGLIAVAVLARQYRDGRGADRARVQAAEAARKAAPVILSYDHRRLEKDFAAARARLTGSFRDEYRRTTTSVVAPTARKYQGVVKASVVEPPGGGDPAVSVVSASPERAVVLLFVNQVTTSTQVSGPRVDLNRVRMTLTLTSDGWKVSAVDAL
ncbi:hypothetical protein [Streptomyces sp. NPDC006368]|uniref:hypothetical protein n=1 Tax=Streptomyces sp. NPDC006368 TaxID=3156760 RepID=UPI0033AD0CDF